MESLAQVDLATLNPDVIKEYAKKVSKIEGLHSLSQEKLELLLLLCQKLIVWLMTDRDEIAKANSKLELELLQTLEELGQLRQSQTKQPVPTIITEDQKQLQQPQQLQEQQQKDKFRKATVLLQKITRGYLARRNFLLMLEQMVYSSP